MDHDSVTGPRVRHILCRLEDRRQSDYVLPSVSARQNHDHRFPKTHLCQVLHQIETAQPPTKWEYGYGRKVASHRMRCLGLAPASALAKRGSYSNTRSLSSLAATGRPTACRRLARLVRILASNNRIYGLKGGFSNRSPEQEDVLNAVRLFPVPDVIGIVLFDGNDGAIRIGPVIEKTDPVFAFGGAQSIFAISTQSTQQGFVTCIRGGVDCMGEIVKGLHRKQSSRMRL